MKTIFGDTRFLVITGNYGSGKTEISLNLALKAAAAEKTTLVDLDIVNPYFRTGEKADELRTRLACPEGYDFVIALALGYAADTKDAHDRREEKISRIGG